MGAEQSRPTPSSRPIPNSNSHSITNLPLPPTTYPPYEPQHPISRRYPSPKPGHPSRKKRAASPLPIPPEMLAVPGQSSSSRKSKSPLSSKRNSLAPSFMFPSSTSASTYSLPISSSSSTRGTGTATPGSNRTVPSMHGRAGSGERSGSGSSSSSGSESGRGSSERIVDGEGMSMGLPPIRVGFPFYEEVLVAAEREQQQHGRRSGEGKRRMFRRSLGGVR
ncbi:hypothetical protein DL98DRAFT_581447 [Cadophora sp. DSE1049]|nr:hypothetical protein DL98DRAFT_581447 [Cadophora sp. DSE1049]